MRVAQDSFAYVYVKLALEKNQFFTEEDFERFDQIGRFPTFLREVRRLYPNIEPDKVTTLVQFEKELYEFFFLKFAKIVGASPAEWQELFLQVLSYFEIENLKKIILGIIAKLPRRDIKVLLYENVEHILEHERVEKALLHQDNIDGVLYILKNSVYAKPLREGLHHYKEEGDLFQVQAYLDRFYYRLLASSEFRLAPECRTIWEEFLTLAIEKYNVVTVFRGIYNEVDRTLLRELLVPGSYTLSEEALYELLALEDLRAFPEVLARHLIKKKNDRALVESTILASDYPFLELDEFYFKIFTRLMDRELALKPYSFAQILLFYKKKLLNIKKLNEIAVKIVHTVQDQPRGEPA